MLNTLVRAKELKPLKELYPRREASKDHVRSLVDALRAGAEFPPLVVEEGTLRIVDGFHRWSAYRELRGPEFEVPCILRAYASERDLFQDAIRENARHGLRFTEADQGRVISLAARLKLTAKDLVPVLRLTTTKMQFVRAEYLTTVRAGARQAPTPQERQPAERNEFKPRKPKNPDLWQATGYINNLSLLLESKVLDPFFADLRRPLSALRSAVRKVAA